MFRLAWGTLLRVGARNELTCISFIVLAAVSCGGNDYTNPATTLQGIAGSRANVFNGGGPVAGSAADSSEGSSTTVSAGGAAPSPGAGGAANRSAGATPAATPGSSGDEAYGWVELDRAMFGSGAANVDALRKPLVVRLSPADGWGDLPAYVTRRSTSTTYVEVVVPLKNTSRELRCFVKADPMVWLSADGAPIAGDRVGASYVSGSLGENDSVSVTNCLGPGETGYFLEVDSSASDAPALFDELAEVELTLTINTVSKFRRPAFRVVATSFTHTGDTLAVTFSNLGSAAAPIELGQAEYILLDAVGEPLSWGFLDTPSLNTLAPNAEVIAESELFYDGKSSSLLVKFSY